MNRRERKRRGRKRWEGKGRLRGRERAEGGEGRKRGGGRARLGYLSMGPRVPSYALASFINNPVPNLSISSLPNLFTGTPRICNFILLLIVWVRSFSKMLPSVKSAEDNSARFRCSP